MKKQRPTRNTKNMIQTALWLPRDMHRRLKEAARDGKMSEEIRRRLEVSMREPVDERTDVLVDLIRKVAHGLLADEAWWGDPFAVNAFKAAINELVVGIPRRETEPTGASKLQIRFGTENPETVGKALAQAVLVSNASELAQLSLKG